MSACMPDTAPAALASAASAPYTRSPRSKFLSHLACVPDALQRVKPVGFELNTEMLQQAVLDLRLLCCAAQSADFLEQS
jgi:hypothetical protein